MGMEKISEAILAKVRAEAKDIIKEAEEKTQERIDKAKKQQAAKLEEEKNRQIEAANDEAIRILAQASIKARQESLLAKTRVVDEITNRVKKTLAVVSGEARNPLNLVREAIDTLKIDKARIYVSPKDISTVKKILGKDKKLADKVTEIRELDCTGGVIIEDIDGKVRIDNTYDTRLEMLLPSMLPEISKELFKDL